MEEIEEADIKYKGELLSQINEQTDRARNIVHSLLEFSRDKKFKKETLPLKSFLKKQSASLEGRYPQMLR